MKDYIRRNDLEDLVMKLREEAMRCDAMANDRLSTPSAQQNKADGMAEAYLDVVHRLTELMQ